MRWFEHFEKRNYDKVDKNVGEIRVGANRRRIGQKRNG